MQIPTINQYASSVAEPEGLTRTLGRFTAERDNYGEIKIRGGNNASVFRVEYEGQDRMLKCYSRPRPDLQEVYSYISASGDPLFPCSRFLPCELFVFDAFGEGGYYDVLLSDWSDGPTLDTAVRRACREADTQTLCSLSRKFDELAVELLSRPWAHGDLKPENIIVTKGGTLRLIDFDALYFPGDRAARSPEVGTPGYQHPGRDENLYDKSIDDYPLALISVSLKALACDTSLYTEYNRSDIILLNPSEVIAGVSEAYPLVKETLASAGCFRHYRLAMMLRSIVPGLPCAGDVYSRIAKPVELDSDCKINVDNGLYGYSTDAGEVVIEPVFEEALPLREAAALVTCAGKKKIIGTDGHFLLGDLQYDTIKPLYEGLCAFRRDGLWGYASRDGEVIIEPSFESAGNMHCGLAPVSREGRWGYIDSSGKCLTGFVYDKAFGFRNGIAEAVAGGKIIKIDSDDILKRPK